MKRRFSGAAVGTAMLALILDSASSLLSAQEGVALCIQTVIPSLFPFLTLSGLLLDACQETPLPILKPLGRLCRMPAGTEGLLIPAFLGGYPVGAQSVGEAFREGQLTKASAERMLGFCSNCGPAFLFGMASALFPEKWMAWGLWGIHIAGAILAAQWFPDEKRPAASLPRHRKQHLSEHLLTAVKVMGMICGWVVLFRVLIGFLKRWILWVLPVQMQVFLMGLLELTNGCCALPLVEPVGLRFCLCAVMLSLGGLCVAMQTASVTDGLSLGPYLRGKMIQSGFSLACSLGIWEPGLLFIPVLFALAVILAGRQKSSSVSAAMGV